MNFEKYIKLIQWFIGFVDAEGNFQIIKWKNLDNSLNISYAFHLSLHIKEHPLIEDLIKELNLPGKVYIYPHRNEVRLAITNREDLQYLISNIFSHYPLINKKQRLRYSKLKEGIIKNIRYFSSLDEFYKFNVSEYIDTNMESQINNLDINSESYGNWLCGFISGEGSFNIKKVKRKEKVYTVKEFGIEQTELNVMELIKKKFQFSPKIYVKNRINRPNSQITYEIRISSKKDIQNLEKFLNTEMYISLLGNKLNQYRSWEIDKV